MIDSRSTSTTVGARSQSQVVTSASTIPSCSHRPPSWWQPRDPVRSLAQLVEVAAAAWIAGVNEDITVGDVEIGVEQVRVGDRDATLAQLREGKLPS